MTREVKRPGKLAMLREISTAGWTVHCQTHWSRDLCGDRLDYWPTKFKYRWRGQTRIGDPLRFIREQV